MITFMRLWEKIRGASIEVQALIIPSLLILPIAGALFYFFPSPANPESLREIFSIFIGGSTLFFKGLQPIIFAISAYILYKIYTGRHNLSECRSSFWLFFRSLGYIALTIILPALAIGSLTLFLFIHVSSSRVIDATELLMKIEHLVFFTFPAFTVQNYPLLFEKFLLLSYSGLFFMWSFTLALTFIFSKKHFRAFVLSFFIFFTIAFASWNLMPVLNPGPMLYLRDTGNYEFPREIERYASDFHISNFLFPFVYDLKKHMFVPGQHVLAVSAFPSAHAGWAFMAAYFAIDLFPLLAVLYVPFLVLLCIATFYLLQHYALDPIWGILLAALSIRLALRLLDRSNETGRTYYAAEEINVLAKKVFSTPKKAFRFLKEKLKRGVTSN